jgi:hypothetical protein
MTTKDPLKLKIPNICFSIAAANDSRQKQFAKERIKYGFDESETWDLGGTIAKFIIPRLELFKKITDECNEEPNKDLTKILTALKLITRDNGSRMFTPKEEKAVQVGLKLLAENWMGLWW